MKNKLLALGASAMAISMVTASPALAAARDTTYGTDAALDAVCVAQVNPSDSSDFTTYATGVQTTIQVITQDVGTPFVVPIGDPTINFNGLVGPVHINGYSPNIWAFHNQVRHWADSQLVVHQETFTRTTHTATGCHVHKPGAGSSAVDHDDLHSDFNAPNGLQITTGFQTVTETTHVPAADRIINAHYGPYDDPNNVIGEQALICISPSSTGTKGAPGTWTAKNGFNGTLKTYPGNVTVQANPTGTDTCSKELYDYAFTQSNTPASDFTQSPEQVTIPNP
jgi:hypothetical protein